MLRTTTECMSAILGGADTVSNISYDSVYHKKNEFGERISRNQLLILKEESYFINASEYPEGSYYIESLTKEISEKALAIFKDIEKGTYSLTVDIENHHLMPGVYYLNYAIRNGKTMELYEKIYTNTVIKVKAKGKQLERGIVHVSETWDLQKTSSIYINHKI